VTEDCVVIPVLEEYSNWVCWIVGTEELTELQSSIYLRPMRTPNETVVKSLSTLESLYSRQRSCRPRIPSVRIKIPFGIEKILKNGNMSPLVSRAAVTQILLRNGA